MLNILYTTLEVVGKFGVLEETLGHHLCQIFLLSLVFDYFVLACDILSRHTAILLYLFSQFGF